MPTNVITIIRTASKLSWLFIAWNVAFFIVALLLSHTIDDDAIGAVYLRGGVYALGGAILISLLKGMEKGKRSDWLRLMIISVLAPLGVIAFIAFTPHLPLWFDVAQIGSAIILAAIAWLILQKQVRQAYPKKHKN